MKIRLFTLPNILTLCNLLLGCMAAVWALRFDDIQIAFWLLVGAAVFDFLDGLVARLLKSYSAIGKELDSLADMVSFGFAPSAVLFSMYQQMGGIGLPGYLVFLLAAFSALRLAKFNVDENQTLGFIGMPTPAAALFVASSGYLMAAGLYTVPAWIVIGAALLLSLLLILPIPMFALKFSHFRFKGNEIRYLFVPILLIALLVWGIVAVPFLIGGYVLLSVGGALFGKI